MNLKKKLAWEGGGWQVRFFIPGGGWFLFCFFSFLWMVGCSCLFLQWWCLNAGLRFSHFCLQSITICQKQ